MQKIAIMRTYIFCSSTKGFPMADIWIICLDPLDLLPTYPYVMFNYQKKQETPMYIEGTSKPKQILINEVIRYQQN